MNLKTIKDRIIALLTDKSSGIQPEFRQQLTAIAKCIEKLLKDNHGACEIPEDLIKKIARRFAHNIVAILETKEAKREFEEWKLE